MLGDSNKRNRIGKHYERNSERRDNTWLIILKVLPSKLEAIPLN